MSGALFLVLIVLSVAGYFLGRAAATSARRRVATKLHSLPAYYGWYVALWCGLPALTVFVLWTGLQDMVVRAIVVAQLPQSLRDLSANDLSLVLTNIRNLAAGHVPRAGADPELLIAVDHFSWLGAVSRMAEWALAIVVGLMGAMIARARIAPALRARVRVETTFEIVFVAASVIAVLTTIGIVLSLVFESMAFFARVSPIDFLFGTQWSPMIAIRPDQVAADGAFGAVPLFVGTLLIAAIAMLVAVPVGLMTAVYMTEYADKRLRATAKPVLEILAGVPTVVYGFFAALTVGPVVARAGAMIGLAVPEQSALAAGVVMGIMIIPFISSLSDDVINAVPQTMRDGSYALGATKSETTTLVLLPAALPGIVASVILGFSKALGETMIVVMAAGLAPNLTLNPLESVTTVTVFINALLTGEQEFDSPKTLAAFALGLVLFVATLALNLIALKIVKRYREQYE